MTPRLASLLLLAAVLCTPAVVAAQASATLPAVVSASTHATSSTTTAAMVQWLFVPSIRFAGGGVFTTGPRGTVAHLDASVGLRVMQRSQRTTGFAMGIDVGYCMQWILPRPGQFAHVGVGAGVGFPGSRAALMFVPQLMVGPMNDTTAIGYRGTVALPLPGGALMELSHQHIVAGNVQSHAFVLGFGFDVGALASFTQRTPGER